MRLTDRRPLPPALEIVLIMGKMDKAEGRVAAKRRDSIAQGETLGVVKRQYVVALKGRHSNGVALMTQRDGRGHRIADAGGIAPFQGYFGVSSTNPGLRPGLWNRTLSGSGMAGKPDEKNGTISLAGGQARQTGTLLSRLQPGFSMSSPLRAKANWPSPAEAG